MTAMCCAGSGVPATVTSPSRAYTARSSCPASSSKARCASISTPTKRVWLNTGAGERFPKALPATTRNSTPGARSEEHTSELQSQSNLVCRLLLEKKKKTTLQHTRSQQNSTTLIRSYKRNKSATLFASLLLYSKLSKRYQVCDILRRHLHHTCPTV